MLVMVLVVLGVIGAAIYYLFFSPVPLIEKVIPQQVQSIKNISLTEFNPETVLNNPTFQILKQYINAVELPQNPTSRSNPFTPLK